MKKNYTVKWAAVPDTDYMHTASTKYVADNFVIWKGKKRIMSCIHSADEWHLIRKSDCMELHYARTAKECKDFLEHNLKEGVDIYTADRFYGYFGMKFDNEFNIIY